MCKSQEKPRLLAIQIQTKPHAANDRCVSRKTIHLIAKITMSITKLHHENQIQQMVADRAVKVITYNQPNTYHTTDVVIGQDMIRSRSDGEKNERSRR
mmetsp:Transcript_9215/g.11903  ORF Transcript_9215/g.11903 Transcript_9215/m.11903 type:complete len:98 (+) Transcript_9215:206-499(+)